MDLCEFERILRPHMAKNNLPFDSHIEVDKYHRFKDPESKKSKTSAFLIVQELSPGFWEARYGSWRDGSYFVCRSKDEKIISPAEQKKIDESRKKIEEAQEAFYQERAREIKETFEKLPECDSHPYLSAKKIRPAPDFKRSGDDLVVPIYSLTGEIQSYQRISPEKGFPKRQASEAKAKGGVYPTKPYKGAKKVYLCEGISDVVALDQAVDESVIACFGTGNVATIATYLSCVEEVESIVLALDNDESGRQTAKKCEDIRGVSSKLPPDPYKDFNDWYCSEGEEALAKVFQNPFTPHIRDAFELAAMEFPPPKPYNELLYPRCMSILYAEPAIGKTWFLLELAACAALNYPFMRFKSFRSAKVLYIDGEMLLDKLSSRLFDIMKGWNLENDNAVFHMLSREDLGSISQINLFNSDHRDFLDEVIKGYDYIFFDNLNKLAFKSGEYGRDLNSYQNVLNWFQKWTMDDTKGIVLALHTNKSKTIQGVAEITAACDFCWRLEAPTDELAQETPELMKTYKDSRKKTVGSFCFIEEKNRHLEDWRYLLAAKVRYLDTCYLKWQTQRLTSNKCLIN